MRWISWITENIQVVILVAGAIAYWLNQRRQAKQALADEANRRRDAAAPDRPAPAETDEAERTRRIQEQIRRKIAERRGPPGPAPMPPAPPIVVPRSENREATPPIGGPLQEMLEEMQRRLSPPPEPEPPPVDQAALARQRALEGKLQALEAEKRVAERRAAELAAMTAVPPPAPNDAEPADSWLVELRDPSQARRAILAREILGAPVALR